MKGQGTQARQDRPLPLSGVRVLDISQVMAGPYACMLLADLGADVIKIEPPGGGDQTRGSMGFKMKGPDSLGFLNMNRNKRSLALNLKTPAGRDLLKRLVREADILVENYRPGAMKRLGLGYDDLKPLNPSFRRKPKDYWVEALLAADIPAGPILSYPEAFDSEHAKARAMRMEIDHPIEGKVPNIGFAVKLSDTPQQVRRHPPLLGEHTAEVLAELGIADEERAALESQGAFSP